MTRVTESEVHASPRTSGASCQAAEQAEKDVIREKEARSAGFGRRVPTQPDLASSCACATAIYCAQARREKVRGMSFLAACCSRKNQGPLKLKVFRVQTPAIQG